MLVLKRKVGEDIIVSVDGQIVATIRVTETGKEWARIAVHADRERVQIDRKELLERKQAAPVTA